MPWRVDLSVRVEPTGGAVADAVASDPSDWLLGRRHVVVFVHGFNNSEKMARTNYSGVFTTTLADDVAYFFWPGDTQAGYILSAPTYPWQIPTALQSARRLADYLQSAFGPGGSPSAVSFVGHSLGCRLVLEAIRIAIDEALPWPEVRLAALMAAAVPVDLVQDGQTLVAAAGSGRLALFYSAADDVLHFAFPPGEAFAYRPLGFEQGLYSLAVGRFGQPESLTAERMDTGLGHGEYWTSEDVADRVGQLLGSAGPRTLAARALPSVSAPLTRSLPVRG